MKKISMALLLSAGLVYADSFKIEILQSDVELQIGDTKGIVSKGTSKTFKCADTINVLHGKGVAVLYKDGKEIKRLTANDLGGYHMPKETCDSFWTKVTGLFGLAQAKVIGTNESIALGVAKGGNKAGIEKDITLDKGDKHTILSSKLGQWGEAPYILNILKKGKVVETLSSKEFEYDETTYVGFALSFDSAKKGDSYEIKSDAKKEPFRGVVGMHGKITIK